MSSNPSPFVTHGKPLCVSCFRGRWLGRPGACQRCGAYNDLLAPRRWEATGPLGKVLNCLLAPLGRSYWLAVGFATLFTLYFQMCGWTFDIPSLLRLALLWVVLGAIWCFRLGFRCLALLLFPAGEAKRPGWRGFLAPLVVLVLLSGLSYLAIPLRLAVYFSRPAILAIPFNKSGRPQSSAGGLYTVTNGWKSNGGTTWVVHESGDIVTYWDELWVSYYPPGSAYYNAPPPGREYISLGRGWYYSRLQGD